MTNLIFALALATLATPAVSHPVLIGAPIPAVDFETSGFEHPGTVRSPNSFVGGLHMAHEPDAPVPARLGSEPTVERVVLRASPVLHTCLHISRGDGRPRREVSCLHYIFPDGQTGPLGIANGVDGSFEYSVAPTVEIDVISSINNVSCMGTADACSQTRYFQVEDGS